MSRGPGIWQRAILDRVNAGKVVILTGPEQTHAEQNAIRRAAYTLERRGLVKITSWNVDGRPRLVANPPGMKAPEPRIVTGVDGKRYRMPRAEASS
jgi:hypothetical protein